MDSPVYQVGNELFHSGCLSDSQRDNAIEIKRSDLETTDECVSCGNLFVNDIDEMSDPGVVKGLPGINGESDEEEVPF